MSSFNTAENTRGLSYTGANCNTEYFTDSTMGAFMVTTSNTNWLKAKEKA